jgi:uncharacterized MAPEG superfamily protein
MTIPFYCVLAAFLLIYVPRFFVAAEQGKQPEGYDNVNPRDQQARLTSARARRAIAAHNNAFEGFAPFAASVFVAHLGGGNASHATALALAYVVARVVYTAVYLAGAGNLRSLVWFAGMLATIGLFGLPVLK